MTLYSFLRVYDNHEPFWINYPVGGGCYDSARFESVDDYYAERRVMNIWSGAEMPFSDDDTIEYITHDCSGVLTLELEDTEV